MAFVGKRSKPPLPKPVLKHLGFSLYRRNLATAIFLSLSAAIAFRVLYCERRKTAYADYYKTYDPEKHYRRMADAGLMQTEPKDD